MTTQRAFNRTPFPRDRPAPRMPTATATAQRNTACPLCDVRVKAGQRVAKHYESQEWAHVGCVVRLTNDNRRAAEAC